MGISLPNPEPLNSVWLWRVWNISNRAGPILLLCFSTSFFAILAHLFSWWLSQLQKETCYFYWDHVKIMNNSGRADISMMLPLIPMPLMFFSCLTVLVKKALLLLFLAGQSTKSPYRCSLITQVSSERLKMILFPDYLHFLKGRKMLASLQDPKHTQESRLIWERRSPLLCLAMPTLGLRAKCEERNAWVPRWKVFLLPVSALGGPLKFEIQAWPAHCIVLLRWKSHTVKMSCRKSPRCRMHVEDKHISCRGDQAASTDTHFCSLGQVPDELAWVENK